MDDDIASFQLPRGLVNGVIFVGVCARSPDLDDELVRLVTPSMVGVSGVYSEGKDALQAFYSSCPIPCEVS